MIRKIILNTICIVLFVSCASSKKNNNLIYGVVYDSSGAKTLSGVKIYNGKKYISSTDFQGRFSFINSFEENQLILKKIGYEEKHIVLDDTNSLDFVRVNLESFEDLCFLCHEYLIKGDFDNAAEILSRIEKINIDNKEIEFALTFGYAKNLFAEDVIEEQFGLKIVLNTVGINDIRKIL